MPFRLNEFRSKIQFTSSARMPSLIYRACLKTGTVSNTVYCQLALAEALSRDLGIPLEEIVAELPEPRGPAAHVFDPSEGKQARRRPVSVDQSGGRVMIGPANTNESVR